MSWKVLSLSNSWNCTCRLHVLITFIIDRKVWKGNYVLLFSYWYLWLAIWCMVQLFEEIRVPNNCFPLSCSFDLASFYRCYYIRCCIIRCVRLSYTLLSAENWITNLQINYWYIWLLICIIVHCLLTCTVPILDFLMIYGLNFGMLCRQLVRYWRPLNTTSAGLLPVIAWGVARYDLKNLCSSWHQLMLFLGSLQNFHHVVHKIFHP